MPQGKAIYYAIVMRDSTGAQNYLYFNGTKFIRTGRGQPYLKGPKSYMMDLAAEVAGFYTSPVFVKPV